MPGPLEGVRIVEMGTMIAVPASTNLLAHQGADIVKVENTTGAMTCVATAASARAA